MERYQFSDQERAALEGLQQPFAIYQFLKGQVVTLVLSDGFCTLFGYKDRDLAVYDMDHDMYKGTHPDDVDWVSKEAIRFATEGGRYDVIYRSLIPGTRDYRIIHAQGSHVFRDGVRLAQVWYTDEGRTVSGEPGRPAIEEVLADAIHEESILRTKRYDHLTGLPALTYFFELANTGTEAIVAAGGQAFLIYLDLNGMKYFNHRNGFAEGDKLLQAVARILSEIFGKTCCCHIGADRFAVYGQTEGLEERIGQVFAQIEQINGGNTLPVRIGIYINGTEELSVSGAYDRAKIACDALPAADVSAFNYYSREMSEREARRRYIQTNIDRAIASGWIKVYYQPIVRAVTERVCDEEALARWIDPEKGFLSPAEFIPYLESSGLIYKLDLYMLEQTLDKMRQTEAQGLSIVPHSINLSRSDFDACDIVEEIRQRVDASGIGRNMITIEITESIVGSDFDFMKEQILRFKALGFPVWMDDFGSGYSSLNVLQSIPFDLIKFDMSFMRKLDEGESGKIILTELMQMATSLGVDTVCEGVETEDQVRFLQEIGCSKLQGYYFNKPVPFEEILARYQNGKQIGYENPKTSAYYESIGRLNLYDLTILANEDAQDIQNTFNTLPMGIIEINGDSARFIRSNPSYRAFMKRFFGITISASRREYRKFSTAFMRNLAQVCCEQESRCFYNDKLPDGTVIHSFSRRINTNPVSGTIAVAVAVLSISEPVEGASFAEIAQALAMDYYNLYVIDLDTEGYIEYTSPVGGEELVVKRRGKSFFRSIRSEARKRIYEPDRELWMGWFTKKNVLRELKNHGVFTSTYRLLEAGEPFYVSMKITPLPGGNRVIMGINIVDSQMKQREQYRRAKQQRDELAKIMAVNDDYLSLYEVDPRTGHYMLYTASKEYEQFNFAIEGEDFFRRGREDGERVIHPEDLPMYLERFTQENVMRDIAESGAFKLSYKLKLGDTPRQVTLRIVPFGEGEDAQLLASVRAWKDRRK